MRSSNALMVTGSVGSIARIASVIKGPNWAGFAAAADQRRYKAWRTARTVVRQVEFRRVFGSEAGAADVRGYAGYCVGRWPSGGLERVADGIGIAEQPVRQTVAEDDCVLCAERPAAQHGDGERAEIIRGDVAQVDRPAGSLAGGCAAIHDRSVHDADTRRERRQLIRDRHG
jgi:hypothetical protein